MKRLFDEMHHVSSDHHADFLLVFLSYADSLTDPTLFEAGEEFLRTYGAEQSVATLDTRPVFLRQRRNDWVKGHYQAREAQVVSDAIYERIRPLTSPATTESPVRAK